MITIRRIRAGEMELYKMVRLAALQDAPYAFTSTYAGALQRTEESWREQVERTVQGSDRATFIVVDADEAVGLAALYRAEGHSEVGELLQVWVAPQYRGGSVAKDLMDAVITWAADNGYRKIIAGVRPENARAIRFYVKYGFTPLDAAQDYGQDPQDVMLEMLVQQRKQKTI